MSDLVRPIGHERIVRGLAESASEDRLPHALLFEGPDGIGKFRAALWLAASLLCDRASAAGQETHGEPCLTCGPCKRVLAGSHADVFVVDARAHDQDELVVGFIAYRPVKPETGYKGPAIEEFLDLRAAEGRGKFVIVREAERMNEAAQNAFLKMLEEPRPGVQIVLETSVPNALLQTVRSRVVRVRFDPLTPDACAAVIVEALGLDRSDPEDAAHLEDLVRISGGAPGSALTLDARSALTIETLVGAALSGARPASEIATELWDLDGDFPGKTPFVRRRTRAETILDLGLDLLVDVERCIAVGESTAAGSVALRHGPLAAELATNAHLRSESARRRLGDAWLSAREDLHLNLSPEGLVDRALAATSPR